jgi:hypothetical protein
MPHLEGNPFRQSDGADPPRLRHQYIPETPKQKLRHLGGLAAAGLPANQTDAVASHHLDDLLLVVMDRQRHLPCAFLCLVDHLHPGLNDVVNIINESPPNLFRQQSQQQLLLLAPYPVAHLPVPLARGQPQRTPTHGALHQRHSA